jgi:hypothetical protein
MTSDIVSEVRGRLSRGYPGRAAERLNAAKNDVAALLRIIDEKEREEKIFVRCLGRLAEVIEGMRGKP